MFDGQHPSNSSKYFFFFVWYDRAMKRVRARLGKSKNTNREAFEFGNLRATASFTWKKNGIFTGEKKECCRIGIHLSLLRA